MYVLMYVCTCQRGFDCFHVHISHFIIYDYFSFSTGGQNNISRYSDLLQVKCFGVQTLVGVRFRHPSRWTLGCTQPLVQWVVGLFPWSKLTGGMAVTTHPFSTQVKERVEYTSPLHSGPSWPDLGKTLPLPHSTLWYEGCSESNAPTFFSLFQNEESNVKIER